MTLLAQFAATGGALANYIEDVFSTYLYTGNGSTQTITNGIDLAGKGGLVWLKNRTGGSGPHNWYTTAIGSASYLDSSQTSGLATYQEALSTYNSDGFSLSSGAAGGNENTFTYASWTFREQEKFFDVVTWTGDGSNPRTISHSLGSTPGCIIVKETNASGGWAVWHRSLGDGYRMVLNSTNASTNVSAADWFGTSNSTITSTGFSVGNNLNTSGRTLVAYLFAHDAGGFGLTGTDNVISCGSFTSSVTGTASITLGYEPQWVMIKCTTTSDSWYITDTMRGMPAPPATTSPYLVPNTAAAEASWGNVNGVNATGWSMAALPASQTFIYIAIRRGPMKVPTTGTSVFTPLTRTGTGAAATITGVGFPPDLLLSRERTGAITGGLWGGHDRLRGTFNLKTSSTQAEQADTTGVTAYNNTSVSVGTDSAIASVNYSGADYINWFFGRAPSFFDEVCYTGDGTTNRQLNHNLTVTPELIIAKTRSAAQGWVVFGSAVGSNTFLQLNTTAASASATIYTSTSTTFGAQANLSYNDNAVTYVAYLFATCPGVSKVGTYTGTGTTQTINCGFTAGARFVMIKRTDNTGDWYVWDSARGIVAGNDPYIFPNSGAAEVTSTDYVDTDNTGFEISSTAPAAINASGGSFIFLASS